MNLIDLHANSELHLSNDQMSDLVAFALSPLGDASQDAGASVACAEAHLRTCAQCAAEFAILRETLVLFREASVAYADQELSRLRRSARLSYPVSSSRRAYPQTLFWVAASVILMAGTLPLEMRWQRSMHTAPATTAASAPARPAESDEALMDDINKELAASVPAPMQALADPTGEGTGQASVQTDAQISDQISNQRKN